MVSHTPPAPGPFQVKRLQCVCVCVLLITPIVSWRQMPDRCALHFSPPHRQPQIATCQLILSAGPRAVFTFNIIVILSDRCVCLHTECPLRYELGVHKAQAWSCRAHEQDLARNKSTLKMKSSLQIVNAAHRQIRAADRNTALCPLMSQITNRADIRLKTNKNTPTWWMAVWSLSNLLESHLRSSPTFPRAVSQTWAASAICRPLPSTEPDLFPSLSY